MVSVCRTIFSLRKSNIWFSILFLAMFSSPVSGSSFRTELIFPTAHGSTKLTPDLTLSDGSIGKSRLNVEQGEVVEKDPDKLVGGATDLPIDKISLHTALEKVNALINQIYRDEIVPLEDLFCPFIKDDVQRLEQSVRYSTRFYRWQKVINAHFMGISAEFLDFKGEKLCYEAALGSTSELLQSRLSALEGLQKEKVEQKEKLEQEKLQKERIVAEVEEINFDSEIRLKCSIPSLTTATKTSRITAKKGLLSVATLEDILKAIFMPAIEKTEYSKESEKAYQSLHSISKAMNHFRYRVKQLVPLFLKGHDYELEGVYGGPDEDDETIQRKIEDSSTTRDETMQKSSTTMVSSTTMGVLEANKGIPVTETNESESDSSDTINSKNPPAKKRKDADPRLRVFIWAENLVAGGGFRAHNHAGALAGGQYFMSNKTSSTVLGFQDARGANPPFGRIHMVTPQMGDIHFWSAWAPISYHWQPSVEDEGPHRLIRTFHFLVYEAASHRDWESDVTSHSIFPKQFNFKVSR